MPTGVDISRIIDSDGVDHKIRSAFTSGIPYAQVDSTSTSTAFTATVPGITELKDGVCMLLKNGVVTSAAGFTINVNGLGAKPSYSNMAAATADTTIFNVNYTMLFVYDEDRVSGGCWICYRGYDANTNTIGYQLRTNSSTLRAADKGYRYRLWFTSADGSEWVPANTSTSTDATTSRTPNTTPINPFGPIVYNSTNGTVNANANLPAATLWQQYAVTIGYSFNEPNGAMTFPDPVYLKCTPQTNGSAVMVELVQALPSTNDGYIYILLGRAYSATAMELITEHPVFYHDGTAIRLWTGAVSSGGGVTSVNGETGAVTLSYSSVGAQQTPFVGTTATTTPAEAMAALQSGRDVYITHTGQFAGVDEDFRFQLTVTGESISGIVSGGAVIEFGGSLYAVLLYGWVGTGQWAYQVKTLASTDDIPTKTSDLTNDSGFLTSAVTSFNGSTGAVTYTAPVTSVNGNTGAITGLQTTGNLVTSVSASSTDSQYPSAKLFYDTVGNIEALLAAI